MSRIAVLSLSSGIFFVLATLIGVAVLNPRPADAAGGALVACPLAEVSFDQGYGVSGTALRPVCTGRSVHGSDGKSTLR